MTTLDPKYISSTPLQWVFVSKDGTGALGDGIVTFYEQDDHSTLKPIYQLDNSAPTGFSELNNPIQLTAIGTFADDNGNDILPYFYPYDEFGNPQLYYVTVESSTGVPQFTRDDWPPNMAEASSGTNPAEIINYVANGQFLLHNDHPVTASVVTNETDTVSYIAQGGWTFEKNSTSTSIDTVSFIRELTSSSDPSTTANPRYYVQIASTGTDIDVNYIRKDLCLTFPDVNKFAGSVETFSWYGSATTGGTPTVTVVLRQYFGTGSSTGGSGNIIETVVGTVQIQGANQFYSIPISFPPNIVPPTTVSPTVDNDYLQICIRLPNSAQTVQFTDFILQPGIVTVESFPQTTNAEFIENSTIGYLPTPKADGSDLYLPLIVTDQGGFYDYSRVGSIFGAFYSPAYAVAQNFPIVPGDGTIYIASAYSPQGIPYSRLGNALIANSATANTPIFGTGANFVTVTSSTNHFTTTINTSGGIVAATAGTTGFGIAGSDPTYTYTVGAAPAAGTYLTFSANSGTTMSPVSRPFFVWYRINGSTIPVVAGTGIMVDITGITDTTVIALMTLQAINAYQFVVIDTRGYFMRGLGGVDPDSRTLGSIQAQAFLSHNHPGSTVAVTNTGAGSGAAVDVVNGGSTAALIIAPQGGNETRPVNIALNWFFYL